MKISKLQKDLIALQQVVEKHSPDQYELVEEYLNEINNKPNSEVLDEFNELANKLQQAASDRDFTAYQTAALNVIKKYDDHSELHEIASERVDRIRRTYAFNNDVQAPTRNMNAAISDGDYELALSYLKEVKKVHSDYRFQIPDTLKMKEDELTSQPPVQVTDRFNNLLSVFNERPNIDTARRIIDLAESDAIIRETYDLSYVREYIADSEQLEIIKNSLRRQMRGE